MRHRALAIAALGAVLLAACQPDKPDDAPAATSQLESKAVSHAEASPGYQAKVMSAKELKAHQDQAETLIVDVRPPESFQREHIAGAINVPWGKLSQGYAQLPKDRFIALYCT